MQRVTCWPGLMALTPANMGCAPSFEPSTTVPALNSLPELVLELVKAEKAPAEATAPTAPTTIRLVSALRAREVLVMEGGLLLGFRLLPRCCGGVRITPWVVGGQIGRASCRERV